MAMLRDRQRQIPNGFRFALPEVGFQSGNFPSFSTLVNQVWGVIQANPGPAAAGGWPTTLAATEAWVDEFNALWCLQNGWGDYVNGNIGPNPPPKWKPRSKFAAHAAGVNAITEWMGSGAEPVSRELSTLRANTCVRCPLNEAGDLSNFFERATAELIRSSVSAFAEQKLSTPLDNKLGVCSACMCPMKLKVHFPIDNLLKHLSPEIRADLDPMCWILKESTK